MSLPRQLYLKTCPDSRLALAVPRLSLMTGPALMSKWSAALPLTDRLLSTLTSFPDSQVV